MRRPRAWFVRLLGLFDRNRHDRELAEEIESNLQLHIEDNIRSGMTPLEARRNALATFGAIDAAKEACRERTRLQSIEMLVWDLKYAVRQLGRHWAATVVAIISLTLCVGANTAIFSIADAVLFKPMRYSDPDRVFILQMLDRQSGRRFTTVAERYLKAINDYHTGLGEVALVEPWKTVIHATDDGMERIRVAAVTPNYFQVLGVTAFRGRVMDAADAAHPGRPAVLTHAAWRRLFNASEEVVGTGVALGGAYFDIVGVLPQGFILPSVFVRDAEIVTLSTPAPATGGTGRGALHPIVRLEPGVTREQAQAEMDALLSPLVRADATGGNATPVLDDIRLVLYPIGQPIMMFLLVAAVLVLLIGCANLATILTSRAKRQEQETGLRAALGAQRMRLVRPVIFEALLIGLTSAVLATLSIAFTFDIFLPYVPPIAYANAPVGVDYRVAGFTFALGLLGSLVFAAGPAWRAARVDLDSVIRGQKTWNRPWMFGRPMVATQVALSVVLVFGAAVALRGFISALSFPLGVTPENVMVIRATPFPSSDLSGVLRQQFYVRAIETVAAHPDVISAGAAGFLPLDSQAADQGARAAGSDARPASIVVHALPGYWETAGISLLRGRLLDWNDVRGNPNAAVLSESASRVLFPGQDPLGAVFENARGRQFTVVGVVSDSAHIRRAASSAKAMNQLYEGPAYVIPAEQTGQMVTIARMRNRQDRALAEIRKQIGSLAPGTVVTTAWWTDTLGDLTMYRNPRFQTFVLTAFSGLALLLTGIGIFGVLTFQVVARTRETGIRMAMGASPRSIVHSTIRQAMIPAGIGIIGGLLATRWLSRLAEAQLYDVNTNDPITLVAPVLTVTVAASLAGYLPALRASRIDPLVALRHE